jgi:TPR repeat protein
MDSLREKSFGGLDSFFEPEQPKTGGRRILLLLALLVALGGAGWWTYTNYLGATESRKPEAATSKASEAPAGKPEKPLTMPETQNAAPAPDAGSAPAAGVQQRQAENASAGAGATRKTVDTTVKPEAKPANPPPPTTALANKSAPKRETIVASAKPSNLPAPAAADTGDAAFRKGEAYLYGRGVPKNCDEAVKYLKTASAKLNAKARSAFGTMYATGHCVPRDLPTSYLWFALALRVDPNNQILEKDLSAVWNQMTPPERQMATRMKQ